MNFAFCLEMLYTEQPFIDRLAVARKDGIKLLEFWDWRDKDLDALRKKMDQLDMKVMNLSGNRNYGMIDPQELAPFLAEVRETSTVAKRLGCSTLMLLVQSLESDGGGRLPSTKLSEQEIDQNIIKAGKKVGKLADELDLDIVIEPLNDTLDHPRYRLQSSAKAFEIINAIDHPRVKILYDIYHMAMQNENVLADIEKNIETIGYFHVADKPGRMEPGTGEIDYPAIFSLLKSLNYQGTVGFELMPFEGNSPRAVKRIMDLIA